MSVGADTKANTLGAAAHLSEVTELPLSPSQSAVMPSVVYSPFPYSLTPQSWLLAKLSDCSVELPLRPSARAAPPLGPRWLDEMLRAWEQRRELTRVNGR